MSLLLLAVAAAIAAPFTTVILRRIHARAGRNRSGQVRTSAPADTRGCERGSPLELRYRRLLAWYPAEHRRVHGDEMIGVLMSGPLPERSRPGLAQSFNLMCGGLRIRLRPGSALSDSDGWRDALAVFSVTAPVLALGSVSLSYWADQRWADFPGRATSIAYLVLYGQALVAPLVLLRLRRTAVIVASAQVLGLVTLAAMSAGGRFYRPGFAIANISVLVAASLAEVAALLASPGPRRGLSLLRARHWSCLAAAAAPAAVFMPTLFVYWRNGFGAGG